jgi:hypothetical protein
MATLGRWREDGKELFFVSVSTESSMWSQSNQDRSSTMTHRSSFFEMRANVYATKEQLHPEF